MRTTKFKKLNDALSQNMHDCNFAIGVANLQQKIEDSARKDRTIFEKTLVDVFGGSNIKLDNESEVNAFLCEHRQIKSILDRLTDDSKVLENGNKTTAQAMKLLSQLRTIKDEVYGVGRWPES
jgi:Rps23 Pro-64 3,4-dihydroxylase Tpa1-like proline 4-hydroxylase